MARRWFPVTSTHTGTDAVAYSDLSETDPGTGSVQNDTVVVGKGATANANHFWQTASIIPTEAELGGNGGTPSSSPYTAQLDVAAIGASTTGKWGTKGVASGGGTNAALVQTNFTGTGLKTFSLNFNEAGAFQPTYPTLLIQYVNGNTMATDTVTIHYNTSNTYWEFTNATAPAAAVANVPLNERRNRRNCNLYA